PRSCPSPCRRVGCAWALLVAPADPTREPITVPSALSAGVDYQNATWYGFLAPGKTPRAVLQTLHDAIIAVSKDPELIEKIKVQGITPRSVGLRDFDAHIRKDMDRLAPLLQTIGGSN